MGRRRGRRRPRRLRGRPDRTAARSRRGTPRSSRASHASGPVGAHRDTATGRARSGLRARRASCGTAPARSAAPRLCASRTPRPSSGTGPAGRQAGHPATSPARFRARASALVEAGRAGRRGLPRGPRCGTPSPHRTSRWSLPSSAPMRSVARLARAPSARYPRSCRLGSRGGRDNPSRKVRTPQGKVVGRPTRGNPRESATETHRRWRSPCRAPHRQG
jgi:hypothetical protein